MLGTMAEVLIRASSGGVALRACARSVLRSCSGPSWVGCVVFGVRYLLMPFCGDKGRMRDLRRVLIVSGAQCGDQVVLYVQHRGRHSPRRRRRDAWRTGGALFRGRDHLTRHHTGIFTFSSGQDDATGTLMESLAPCAALHVPTRIPPQATMSPSDLDSSPIHLRMHNYNDTQKTTSRRTHTQTIMSR